jgi:hypothetical protein
VLLGRDKTLEPVGKWLCGLLILLFGCRSYGAGSAPSVMRRRAGRCAGQLPGHDRDGGPQHHRFVVLGASFVVADQAAVAHQPAESPFHDPPTRGVVKVADAKCHLATVTSLMMVSAKVASGRR